MKTRYFIACLLSATHMACMGQAFDWMCATEDMSKNFPQRGYGDTMYRPYIPYRYENSIPVQVNLVFLQKNNCHVLLINRLIINYIEF